MNPLNLFMKKLILLISFALPFYSFAQTPIKTAEDTAFILDRVYYPQMQIKMSISIITSDFSTAPKKTAYLSEIDSLNKLIKKEPTKGDHYLALGGIYNEFHRTKEADSIRKIAKDLFIGDMMKNPADTHAIACMANIYLGELDWQLAYAYFSELTKQTPESSVGWNGLAMISMASYDFDIAITQMEKAINAEPDNIDNYCQMANIMMMKSVFDLNKLDSATMDTLTYKGIVNKNFIQKGLKLNPENETLKAILDAMLLTGIIYQAFIDNSEKFTGRGDTISFLLSSEINRAIDGIEKNMETRAAKTFCDREFPYTCLMLISFLRNDPDKAMNWFEKGIHFNPRSQTLYENMTGVCALMMRRDCAYRLQLKLDSIHPLVNNFLMTAYFYYLDKRFEQSKIWTQKVFTLDPENFNALMGMAALSTRELNFPTAATYLDKAAGIDKEHPDVQLLMGILYLFDNSPIMAKSIFTELLKNEQSTIEVEELLERFCK